MIAFTLHANYVDISQENIFAAKVEIQAGKIYAIQHLGDEDFALPYLLPGFIDSHVHIESSMLTPAEFARLAVVHGTVATISDPHEIANVCGISGVQYMIENGKTVPFKFHFGAPSCVPATIFETAGDAIPSEQIRELMQSDDIYYLSEMMNFPGVIYDDAEVHAKIKYALDAHKPVDGHAPALSGKDLQKYVAAGISTDHECFTKEEALEKLGLGMKILIREGSAAKNFEALIPLLHDYPEQMMFCSDDKHPDSLVQGHINTLCARAVEKGIPLFHILQAACVNPVLHYKMDVGLLQIDQPADCILVKNLKDFQVLETYIHGELVAQNGETRIPRSIETLEPINRFSIGEIEESEVALSAAGSSYQAICIEALDGQLITHKYEAELPIISGEVKSDVSQDILKIVVLNRYESKPAAVAFIKNMGFKKGAIASSVAHDSHNIVAVGVDDASITRAINEIIKVKGGISVVNEENVHVLPLPVGGLMSQTDGYEVAARYTHLDAEAKKLGSRLSAPFMTLSFMALLVIPSIKLSDKGLFDGDSFQFIG